MGTTRARPRPSAWLRTATAAITRDLERRRRLARDRGGDLEGRDALAGGSGCFGLAGRVGPRTSRPSRAVHAAVVSSTAPRSTRSSATGPARPA